MASYVEGRPVLTSSVLAAVEVPRAAERATDDERARPRAERLLDAVDLIALEPELIVSARDLRPSALGSLDAIHVASALSLERELDAFVSYDRRQLEAARDAGLAIECPGQSLPLSGGPTRER